MGGSIPLSYWEHTMRHSLLLACSGICIAAAQAVEYGSTTLTHVAQPESAVFDYATQVCGKSAALPRALALPGCEAKAGHIVCMSGESRTGDVFSRIEADRIYINYRLDQGLSEVR